MGYIDVPVETEPVDLADEAYAYLEAQVPGWLPSPGNLEAWLVEALSQIASELRELAALVPESIFFYFGESILGLAPYPAVQASGTTTWTAIDAGGYTVEAGTLVAVSPPATGTAYAFEVTSAVTIPAGSTQATAVEIRALEAGTAASGITGTVQMLDTLDFIQTVTLDAPTSGGSDAETVEAYLARLSDLLTLLSPRPILPQDFAVLVQRSLPSVARATAIDLYNASTGETDCPRCVTVAVADSHGEPVPAQVKADADALLQAQREVNFLTFIVDPTYTTISVNTHVQCWPGYDPAQVAALVQSNLAAYLSPATWGVPPYGDTGAGSWINDTTIRYLELTEMVNRTDGVHYVIALAFGIEGQAQGLAAGATASDQEPPASLTPDTFAERLYGALAPVAQLDPTVDWSLLIYCNALGVMFQLLEDWERDTEAGPGWSLLLDLDRCPDEALPWLAQFVGVRLLPGSTPDEMRARIASTDGFRRGTADAMRGAAAATLTGAKAVVFRERNGANMGYPASPDYAYCLDVVTYDSQTPDPAATEAALLKQKPGGILLTYRHTPGQDYQSVRDDNATYLALSTKYASYDAVRLDTPA